MHTHDPATFDWNDCYTGTHRDHEPPDPLVLEITSALAPGRVLDVGCGAGGLLLELARRGFEVTGVDLSKNAIAAARHVFEGHGLEASLHVGDAASWQPDGQFDLVTNCFALPGTRADQHSAMRMMRDALAPGGTVVLKDFDVSMKRHAGAFGAFHHPTVEEICASFEGLDVERAEVVDTPPHHHGGQEISKEQWTAVLLVARKRL